VHDLAAGSIREYRSPIPGRLLRSPAVSPDGLRVVVQVAQSGVWLLHLSDGQMRSVLADPSADAFAWASDGRSVAFHSRRDGQWGIWFIAL
jgi:Tol biopolymer transport system component